MDKIKAVAKLEAIQQEHLLQFFDQLSQEEKNELLLQIENLDIKIFKEQQALILTKRKMTEEAIEPFTGAIDAGTLGDELGKKLLSEGKFGCLIVAGGQGSRLQFKGAKGTFPLSAVKKKSLFQIFAEKTIAAEKLANHPLPLAIMTSEENDQEIKDFFTSNDHFGLDPQQISYFSQQNLPILDFNGNLFLETPSKISVGPDGNGSSLQRFVASGIFEDWMKKGVQFVNYILIDNPLADPFDVKLLDFQARQKAEIVVKCVEKETPQENVGVLVSLDGHLKVIEYSEMSDLNRFERDESNNLKFKLANISLFSFSMDFIKKIVDFQMPLHSAKKAVPYLDKSGKTVKPSLPNAWKFEKFIFDVLAVADHVEVLKFLRNSCFAPLKNLKGDHSVESVQELMQDLDYATICRITGGHDVVLKPFEIAQDFYYPTEELIAKWKGKKIPDEHYIRN